MTKTNGTAGGASRYGPTGNYTKLPNKIIDEWGRHVVRSLGSAHAWVLTVVIRLTVGYGQQSREVSAPALARLTGLSRARVCEVLEDLEAVGVVTRERRPGRPTRLGVVLEWRPTRQVLACGEKLRGERSARKHPDDGKGANPSTPVDNLEGGDPSTPAGDHPSTPVDTSKDSACVETMSECCDEASEDGETRRKKESAGSENVSGESAAREASSLGEERKTTPPPSSSSCSVEVRDPGGDRDSSDDDKNKGFSQSKPELGKETRVNGGGSCEKAARKSWQEVGDYIRAIPEARITEEARELAEKLGNKIPRIQVPRLERLALHCIETGNVPHVATTVSSIEEKLKFEADNPWSYPIKALHPFPDTDAGPTAGDARESFEAAYEASQPARTLGGAARRHNFKGVQNSNPRPTEGFLERL